MKPFNRPGKVRSVSNEITVINFMNVEDLEWVSDGNLQSCERSWVEQRQFVPLAASALGNHSVVEDVKRELAALQPSRPNLAGETEN